MKIKAKVLDSSLIKKPSEKDLKKGLRYITVVVEVFSKTVNEKEYGEALLYTIKSVDQLDLELNQFYIFDGKLWEMRTDDQEPIRGLTLKEFIKLA